MPNRYGPSAFGCARLELNSEELQQVAQFAYNLSGMRVERDKLIALRTQLAQRVGQVGTDSVETYLNLLCSPERVSERQEFLEQLTVHTTAFFRQEQHFEHLSQVGFADLLSKGLGENHPLRIWSAGCSNGAELFSALIAFIEFSETNKRSVLVEGIGSDLSRVILTKAKSAIYSGTEIAGLNEDRRRRFLLQAKSGADRFRVVPALRELCTWKVSNLYEFETSWPTEIDVVFLRNVLIYMDRNSGTRVLNNVIRCMNPGGILMVGHSEGFIDLPSGMQQVGPTTYQKMS